MIEVFKTNVGLSIHAKMLTDVIHSRFDGYAANFDLEDCDRILRIEAGAGVDHVAIVGLLRDFGFHGEVLADDEPVLR